MGARDDYGDGVGLLSSTAVLFRAPPAQYGQPAWAFSASRLDLLLYIAPGQARSGVADLYVTLFADDGSAARAPGAQIGSPWSLANSHATFSASGATWLQVDVSGAGWPVLSPGTYAWLALSTGWASETISDGGAFDGVVWAGLTTTTSGPLPAELTSGGLFTARQLVSQRFYGDTAFGAGTAAAVSFLQGASGWASVTNAATRYRNWAASGSAVRYGLQVTGWQVTPSRSPTPSGEGRGSRA